MNMKNIRASDVATYLFCARAWWYQQKGIGSRNMTDLKRGSELHRRHGRQVFASGLIRSLAWILLLLALVLLVAFWTGKMI